MSAESSSSISMPEFSESNNMLLMSLMEETQEDQNYADDSLMSMIQSLEAELSSSSDMEVEQVDDQDCSTPSSISFSTDDWDDMEVISSFDEEMMMTAWSLCAAGGDDISGDYYSSEFYYDGLLLDNYLLPQESSDVILF